MKNETKTKNTSLLSNISVKLRIAIICLIPAVGLIYVGGNQIFTDYQESAEADYLVKVIEGLPVATELINQLQRERGASIGFLSSGGLAFKDAIADQVVATDKALAAYNDTYNAEHRQKLGPRLGEIALEAISDLARLDAVRANVISQSISEVETVEFFTIAVDDLLTVVESAEKVASNPGIVNALVAYDLLLQVKEKAGLERAVGARGFNNGSFDLATYNIFIGLVAQQEITSKLFRTFVKEASLASVKEIVAGPAMVEIKSIRKRIASAGPQAALTGVTAQDWFEIATKHIGYYKQIEDLLSADLIADAAGIAAASQARLWMAVAINTAIALLTLVLGVIVVRSVTVPVGRLTDTMRSLADGNLETEVEGIANKDELGDMARAVEVFKQNGLKVRDMTEAEAERIKRVARERTEMMGELKSGFGIVVDAAIAGDLQKRVPTEFADEELNQLAGGINNLLDTVERGISETGKVLSALSSLDLTPRVMGAYEGAFDTLKNDTNAMADKLTEIVGQLRLTSRGVKTATGEILSGANDLSERTTRQAATIEQTSAAMEQLATTVTQNAERAEKAGAVANDVTVAAEKGGEVMHKANDAMERITSSSAKISNIIGMIDDIAFQTNLLALNASVEAARAGEAGKGFAVVAIEVRRLAQSAAEASSEVKVLIEQSATEVSQGSKLVSTAADKLEEMLEAVRQNSSLMQSIATESREQASSIGEVNAAVRQMDEMTQHNAALVEQTNAAIEQTESQASELDGIVDQFKVGGEGAPAASNPRPNGVRAHGARPNGVRELQSKVASAAKSYLTEGSAAVDSDWQEF